MEKKSSIKSGYLTRENCYICCKSLAGAGCDNSSVLGIFESKNHKLIGLKHTRISPNQNTCFMSAIWINGIADILDLFLTLIIKGNTGQDKPLEHFSPSYIG